LWRVTVPLALGVTVLAVSVGLTACGSRTGSVASTPSAAGTVRAVGAESTYANVISQIGGRYVSVAAVMTNPNTDPHTFEASSEVAREVSRAELVVQNGLGYDSFMNKIESASPSASRRVIDAQTLLHLPDSTPNPHLWYAPTTMPAVARALGADLSRLQPDHAAYFRGRVTAFLASLRPWLAALAQLKATRPHPPVATTEPVGDGMLQAAGADDLTPFGLQADIMNGVDPAPQYVAVEEQLLTKREVKALVYNEQVSDPLTETFLHAAETHGIPVVAVYETMPVPGYSYASWMLAEVRALQRAVADGISTERL
jgi:zinc/manganese transport system substrate-binding protein